MMRRIAIAIFLWAWSAMAAFCGPLGGVSPPDPFILTEFPGQAYGNSNAAGLTPASSVIPNTWAVVVVIGQSLGASNAQGTYSTVSANSLMLSVYDGGEYPCAGPVLGASFMGVAGSKINSPNCQIADGLIAAGTFPGVVMVPIAINGTAVADWNGSQLSSRITATWNRLKALGLTGNPMYVMWHQGEQDAFLGTLGPAYTAGVQSVASQWRALGYTGPFIVATETVSGNVASPTIEAAQAAAVSSSLHIVLGANWDSLTGGTYRYDGTHPTAAGAIAFAGLDVTFITSCHNTSC